MAMFNLQGKVAIITGSSRGIGRAIAEAFAAQGAKVVISSRKALACSEVAANIQARYGEGSALAIAASISSRSELSELVERTEEHFGAVDILVCNAASNPYYGPLSGIQDEQFRKILENNIMANHWLVQLTAPGMLKRGRGSIIIVSSIGATRGSAIIGAYNISKAADLELARNLAVEFGPYGVRANCIAPGLIQTDFSRALWENPENFRRLQAMTPMKRIGQPDDIAAAAVFLASDESSYVTGQTLVVDGGATITMP